MECISCEADINPKFKHAIEQNVCPFCGGSIMEELLKSLLISLQETMAKMQEYSEQLDDWLLSNYNYIKTDSPNLVAYVPQEVLKELKKDSDDQEFQRKRRLEKVKIRNEDGKVEEQEVLVEQIQSNARTAGFFERAELIKRGERDDDGDLDTGDDTTIPEDDEVELKSVKPTAKPKTFKSAAERTQYLKGIKKKIEIEAKGKKTGVISQEGLASMMEGSGGEAEADPEDVAAFQAALSEGDIIVSSLPNSSIDDEDAMTERVLAANLASSKGKNKGHGGDYNEQDIRALQRMQARVSGAHQSFENGKNRGKNGFSRS